MKLKPKSNAKQASSIVWDTTYVCSKNKSDFGSAVFNWADSSPEVRAAVNTQGPDISDGKRSDIQEGFGFMALLKPRLLPILRVCPS